MTIEELENKLNAAYELDNQAKEVARKVMNMFIREYITTTSSNIIAFEDDENVEYHIADSTLPYYQAAYIMVTYNGQDYKVTVVSTQGDEHTLTETDITYNNVSDIILCKLYDRNRLTETGDQRS